MQELRKSGEKFKPKYSQHEPDGIINQCRKYCSFRHHSDDVRLWVAYMRISENARDRQFNMHLKIALIKVHCDD
jgi:hypothetical protein